MVASHGRHCLVESPDGTRRLCHPRGKKSQSVVGDRVQWQATGDEGVIVSVQPRRNLFYRQDEIRTKSFAANLDGPNDALALLLFMLALPVFTYFISPLMARFSRKHEFEADAFAARQTSGSDLGRALLKLYEDNASTLTPDPVFVKFYYSHPPASERLARMTAGSPA